MVSLTLPRKFEHRIYSSDNNNNNNYIKTSISKEVWINAKKVLSIGMKLLNHNHLRAKKMNYN